MSWTTLGLALLAQLGALAAFFAFPAIQYLILRRLATSEGRPELWFLPRYGFRLVMRNLPRRKTFTGIRYRARLRTVVAAGEGSSVATLVDALILDRDEFFLFPGFD